MKSMNILLKVIRHEGRTFETTPMTFQKLDEGDIRNIILAHLNGHLEGEATGETFRAKGKTDIRVEGQNRSAFIGECKVWRGEGIVKKTIDQVLGYTTWRDCKIAIVIFNKDNANFSAIKKKVPEQVAQHDLYLGSLALPNNREGEWRYRFRSKEDPEQQFSIHVFLFDLKAN